MSLVYEALCREGAGTGTAATPPPAATPGAGPWLSRHRIAALWLLAGALVAGPVALLVPRADAPAPRSAPPHAAAAPTTEAAVASANLPAPALSAPPPMAGPATGSVQAPALPVDTMAGPAEPGSPHQPGPAIAAPVADAVVRAGLASSPPPAAAPAQPAGQVEIQIDHAQGRLSVRSRDDVAPGEAGDQARAAAVRSAMGSLHSAVADGNQEQADHAVAQLQSLLPAQSLTLLRAHAWHAHGGGDFTRAESLYRQILERVPDDEHAGVNLALLEARLGELAQARNRLDRLATRNKRSPQIAQALAELDAVHP